MRQPISNSETRTLKNGILVKGTYKYSIRGCYFDLFVMSKDGYLLGSYNYAIRGTVDHAQVRLNKSIEIMQNILSQYKVDQVTSIKAIQSVVPEILRKGIDKNLFLNLV